MEPRRSLADTWASSQGAYELSVYGPNGFYRGFKGSVSGRHRADLDVREVYDEQRTAIALEFSNRASHVANITVVSAYGSRPVDLVLRPGQVESRSWSLVRTSGWYDLTITVEGDSVFECCFAGHLENGQDSISDPAMGGLF